ncbi:hypothetical protein F5050DRAFT_1580540 [Lentinula boryana]|uniref:UvrD-like helicase C-terminal domain-containing protein n=2 Tax=Lentinula TaxID=5352 RepID=A0A9W8TSV6_9AGAR|nr:hypothetical protein DFH05DRAFT_1408366 [Lentinula detonsa]KAJ3742249.1 hypothetical protein DFH05DRAFT_1402293 [Lentinula detonsa]KAJ3800246.1 hypothetical protein GGU11DRAFT_677781 [Lentinula aff. detonsa]KAJ3991919.1 hypothetical protein F5050DRAFT_1580540 [Lentinula boryana]
MTTAYAFTDYRAQGQTIPYVLVDIAKPPTGKLTLFNLYVALSRSSELMMEDERLEKLNTKTKKWWNEIRDDVV